MAALSPPLAGFDFDFDFTPSSLSHHPPTDLVSPHYRPDTPQLTLHDYHKFQQSPPLLSASPDSEHRRVRRKPSVANLAAAPAQLDFSWTSTSPVSPNFIHSFAPRSLLLSSLPPPPTTPRPRPTTASPSLSSTVTTLQSTPTHTPVLRGGSHFEQRRVNERVELTEPIRTKRKFDTLKQAKRLPRRADGGGERSTEHDGAIWEVYAAVFEPSAEYQGLEEELVEVNEETDGQAWLQPAPLFAQKREPLDLKSRTVRFQEAEPTPDAPNESEAEDLTTQGVGSREEKETTATSSYSLSKFQFPVPPGHDNWAGTFGHLTEPTSPSSPATLHYRGASFDVVNPHASLLLEGHNFETPAEIDGLLDDYFDARSDANMPYDGLTGEASQSSLRVGSDSSRHGRVLYDDPDSARRHILRTEEELPTPLKTVLSDSPLANKNAAIPNDQDSNPVLHAGQQGEYRANTNPFRNLPSIGRILGYGNAPEQGHPEGHTATIEEADPSDEEAFGSVDANLSPSASGQLKSVHGSQKRYTGCSDPFDLTVSEDGSRANLLTIDEVLKKERRTENVPDVSKGVDPVYVPFPDDGAVSQATYGDQESDPTIKEIIGSYDYTVVPSSPENDDPANDSPSVEHGRGISSKAEGKKPMPIAHLPVPVKKSAPIGEAIMNDHAEDKDEVKTPDSAVAPTPKFPTPPQPVYAGGGVTYWSDCTELRTSQQTYGETNQLLQITPASQEARYAPYPSLSDRNPYRNNAYGTPTGSPYSQAGLNESTGTVVRHNRNSGVPNQFRFDDEDDENHGQENEVRGSLPRSSSVYDFDNVYDGQAPAENESVWETASRSSTVLPHAKGHPSEDSYADTSAYGPENRLSAGPDAFTEAPPMPTTRRNERTNFEAPPMSPADENDHLRDTQKAASLLAGSVPFEEMRTKTGSIPNFDKEQRKLDLAELERLRENNPRAIRDASEYLATRSMENIAEAPKSRAFAKLQKANPHKPKYNPENIFQKAMNLGLGTSSNRSAISERRLLGTPDSFVGQNNLEWSDSQADFVTVRDGKSPRQWTPFSENATDQALAVPSRPASISGSAIGRGGVELAHRPERDSVPQPYMPAMDRQVELRPLLLQSGRTLPPRGHGLTDRELARREPAWTTEPRGLTSNSAGNTQPGNPHPAISLAPRLVTGRDLEAQAEEQLPMRQVRDHVSKLYCYLSGVLPPLTVLFWVGGFDWIMRRATNGRVREMNPSSKKIAVRYVLPCSLFVWLLMLAMGIVIYHVTKDKDEFIGLPGQSNP